LSELSARWSIVAVLVLVAASAAADNLQVEPFDQSAQNAEFAAFLGRFKDAVDDRNVDAVADLARSDVAAFNDPGGGGVTTLREQLTEGWSGAGADAYWDEMDKVLALGGGFLADGRYCAPYVYAYALPGAKDSLSDAFIIRDRAKLYEKPALDSGVLGHFSYRVVPIARWLDRDWVEVLLADGRKGYLSRRDFRIRGDYHLCFARDSDGWRLTVFDVGE
jgi:hypothetical protein